MANNVISMLWWYFLYFILWQITFQQSSDLWKGHYVFISSERSSFDGNLSLIVFTNIKGCNGDLLQINNGASLNSHHVNTMRTMITSHRTSSILHRTQGVVSNVKEWCIIIKAWYFLVLVVLWTLARIHTLHSMGSVLPINLISLEDVVQWNPTLQWNHTILQWDHTIIQWDHTILQWNHTTLQWDHTIIQLNDWNALIFILAWFSMSPLPLNISDHTMRVNSSDDILLILQYVTFVHTCQLNIWNRVLHCRTE